MTPRKLSYKPFFLTLLLGLLLSGCGGAPSNNPSFDSSTIDGEIEVDDGIVMLSFVSASPDQISLKGQGGAESSIVTFVVTDTSSDPIGGVQVRFSLDTSVGGISLAGSYTLVSSDGDGLIAVTVASGTVSTVAHVVAEVIGSDVAAISDDITVSSGIPVDGHLSVGADWYKSGTLDTVGTNVGFVVVASDQFGNYAFDGTRISFWTPYYGAIDSSCTISSGRCSASWTSTAGAGIINPYNDPWIPVLVFSSGAEFFNDLNGNNVYDDNEAFVDLGEAYLDLNTNASYEVGEYFLDSNDNGIRDEGNGVYDGPCQKETCPGKSAVTIWTEMRLHMCPSDVEGLGYPCEQD
ncbi:hypothetical protein [Teredinibacter haidensis]|uniref:hypothetical protein n=1 Tax=Teredinibacter haidensis TaxID=2731755 RepID=UPI000948C34F|nr:hypothetical protein [Teredinibacter haidensis]